MAFESSIWQTSCSMSSGDFPGSISCPCGSTARITKYMQFLSILHLNREKRGSSQVWEGPRCLIVRCVRF